MTLLPDYPCVVVLVLSLFLHPPTASAQSCPCNTSSNYALLMDFYSTSTGWIHSNGWGDTSVPICSWWGDYYSIVDNGVAVVCNGTNIAGIKLQDNGITGTLPPSWSGMTQLQWLDLYSNSLTGTLPPSWSNMTQLQGLYLDGNSLTGTLPPSWSSMTEP